MDEHQQFWTWFMRHVCEVNRVMIANVGTFTLSYKNERFYIRFKPTGYFGFVYRNTTGAMRLQPHIFGEEFPVQNAKIWAPIVMKNNSISQLSQQRQLMWHYAEHRSIKISVSAQIVSSAIQTLCSTILHERRIELTPHWEILCYDTSRYDNRNTRYIYSRIGHTHLLYVMSQMGIG